MAEAPLPVGYEGLITEVETQTEAVPEDGTINSKSSCKVACEMCWVSDQLILKLLEAAR